MGEIFAYSIVSGLLLLAMYPVYKWLLSGERQHSFNRAMLWAIYLMALLLPLLLPSLRELTARLAVGADGLTPAAVTIGHPEATVVERGVPLLPRILLWVYLAGLILSLAYTLLTFLRLRRLIGEGDARPCDSYTLVLTDRPEVAPFSWKSFIVISRRDYEISGRVILTHETRHLDLNHWIDLVMAQGVAIFMWYNPVSWLMREELKAVHEYQADEAVMTSGADLKEYQMLLVKKAVGARFPSLANSLNHSKLKKRITMMHKNRSNVVRRMWAFALFPAAAVAIAVTGTPAVSTILSQASAATLGVRSVGKVTENTSSVQPSVAKSSPGVAASVTPIYFIDGTRQPDDFDISTLDPSSIAAMTVNKDSATPEIHIELEKNGGSNTSAKSGFDNEMVISVAPTVLPEFPGGIDALVGWLSEHISYPEAAVKAGEEGRVVVRFIVDTSGRISEPEIMRSVSPSLDAEAIRVVKEMPAWRPGMEDGKPVACKYVLPLQFSLPK